MRFLTYLTVNTLHINYALLTLTYSKHAAYQLCSSHLALQKTRRTPIMQLSLTLQYTRRIPIMHFLPYLTVNTPHTNYAVLTLPYIKHAAYQLCISYLTLQ